MNTRIQVESIQCNGRNGLAGVDLVKNNCIAAGFYHSYKQEDIKVKGQHGMSYQCRRSKTFLPSPGKVAHLHLPGGLGVRWDSHVYAGYTVPPLRFYDRKINHMVILVMSQSIVYKCIYQRRSLMVSK